MVYSVVIFSQRYLDSDCINFKACFPGCLYWSIWTSSHNTDLKVQQFFEIQWSLHNVKQCRPTSLKVIFPSKPTLRDLLFNFMPHRLTHSDSGIIAQWRRFYFAVGCISLSTPAHVHVLWTFSESNQNQDWVWIRSPPSNNHLLKGEVQ